MRINKFITVTRHKNVDDTSFPGADRFDASNREALAQSHFNINGRRIQNALRQLQPPVDSAVYEVNVEGDTFTLHYPGGYHLFTQSKAPAPRGGMEFPGDLIERAVRTEEAMQSEADRLLEALPEKALSTGAELQNRLAMPIEEGIVKADKGVLSGLIKKAFKRFLK